MKCNEARALVDAWMDGELELARQLEVEAHLQGCAECRRLFEARRATQSALRTSGLYHRAPAGLERRVRGTRSGLAVSGTRWAAIGLAAAAILLLVVSGAAWLRSGARAREVLAQQVISAHIRALQPGHLLDVATSDQHTVKPWFAGRLDFSPPVVDLGDRGFPLAGGRLDSIDGRSVAALVYRRRQHTINLFVWPSGNEPGPRLFHVRGFNLVHWTRSGLVFWAVSDLNATELDEFARSFLVDVPDR